MLTYTRFNSSSDSEYLIELLQKNDIPYELIEESNQLTNVFLGESLDQLYVLKIPAEQFNKVNQILASEASVDFKKEGFIHYFSDFSKDDLINVLNSPNDWNSYDTEIARLYLERDYQITKTASSKYADSYIPESISLQWLVVGYISSFSIIGLIGGSLVRTSKKTLPNGKRVFIYDKSTRLHALIIFCIGVIGTTFFFLRIFLR